MLTNVKRKKEIDIVGGPILKSMILYALPLIATNLLQLLFNAADVAVLGIFSESGDGAVAAVGATGSLIQLIINLFVGLSVGTNVLVARCVGSGETERSQRIVGCSVVTSLLCGVILLFVGFFGARVFLIWMKCDPAVLDMAVKYLKVYFLGMPIIMLYNFSTAVLRGVGDTFRPLIYLVIGGIANVFLNVFFVLVLKKDVEGVAIATVVSNGISAVFAILALFKETGAALESGKACGAKCVRKNSPQEKVGVLCEKDGKAAVIEYYELTEETANARAADGSLEYSYGVILNYLFSLERLEKTERETIPVHIVKKKIPYVNERGEKCEPQRENGLKFETLAVDLISFMGSVLPCEVRREKEFAPVKNATGADSVETARALLELNGVTL